MKKRRRRGEKLPLSASTLCKAWNREQGPCVLHAVQIIRLFLLFSSFFVSSILLLLLFLHYVDR